jgi:C_GCAxxG_C_C family probable redox protein
MNMTNPEKAKERIANFSCSQSILSTYCEELGLDEKMALKIADGFAGGMGNSGLTCGTVTGAIMVIGLKHGRSEPYEKGMDFTVGSLVKKFIKKFTERYGCTECMKLIDFDISTEEGVMKAIETDVFKNCPNFVEGAAEILDEIL